MTVYVMQPRDPEAQLRNELIHTYDETFRLDGFLAVIYTDNARLFLIRKRGFIDVTETMLDRKAVAEDLGVLVTNVDMWTRRNELKSYGAGRDAVYLPADVQAFKTKRGENA